MKYLAIDYGTKRTGIAVSDPDGKLAFPRSVIQTSSALVADLVAVILKESCYEIILGRSINAKGEKNPVMVPIEKLKSDLEVRGYTVTYEDERYSSMQAAREQGENDMHDASTAAVILQGFLDRQHRAPLENDPYAPRPE